MGGGGGDDGSEGCDVMEMRSCLGEVDAMEAVEACLSVRWVVLLGEVMKRERAKEVALYR